MSTTLQAACGRQNVKTHHLFAILDAVVLKRLGLPHALLPTLVAVVDRNLDQAWRNEPPLDALQRPLLALNFVHKLLAHPMRLELPARLFGVSELGPHARGLGRDLKRKRRVG